MAKVPWESVIPPPPPPPPCPLNARSTPTNEQPKHVYDPQSEIRKLCEILIKRLDLKSNQNLLVHHKSCQPILQEGPMCGLVAVCMAAETLSKPIPSVEDVFVTAKALGYTRQGEMFSAIQMCDLARVVIGCEAVICSDTSEQKDFIMNMVSSGNPILVPYDADGNHEPCLKQGKKAHWAVISGVIYVTQENQSPPYGDFHPDPVLPQIYHNVQNEEEQPLVQEITSISPTEVYLLARQGKSKHIGLWSIQSLLDSNSNLEELDPKIASNMDDYVIPAGGPADGLKGHIICLQRTS